jgi:tryptophanyl-tRNA synthetase
MTQFKTKAQQHDHHLGLYAYPVLQAADILLYRATHVPIGQDQKQHVELTRDVAQLFNRLYGQDLFVLPEPMVTSFGRIMSLRDPTRKMSKSDSVEASRIHINDGREVVEHKIRRAVTDSSPLAIRHDLPNRPGLLNLVHIVAGLQDVDVQVVLDMYGDCSASAFKQHVTTLVNGHLDPIRQRLGELDSDAARSDTWLHDTLQEGTARAHSIAESNMLTLTKSIGL